MKRKDIAVSAAVLAISSAIIGGSLNVINEANENIEKNGRITNDIVKRYILSQEYIDAVNSQHSQLFDAVVKEEISYDDAIKQYEEILSYENVGNILNQSKSEEFKEDKATFNKAQEVISKNEDKKGLNENICTAGIVGALMSGIYTVFESAVAVSQAVKNRLSNKSNKANEREEKLKYMLSPIRHSMFAKEKEDPNKTLKNLEIERDEEELTEEDLKQLREAIAEKKANKAYIPYESSAFEKEDFMNEIEKESELGE